MPKPHKEETEQEYVSRFMGDPESRKDYPDEKQRAAVAYSMWRHRNTIENAQGNKWPRLYSCRFIEPGFVHYNEYGTVLVKKEVLEKMSPSFVGKPVINEQHKEARPEGFATGEYDGVVTRTWFNAQDGWYWADFLVWDEGTKRNCDSKTYSVSCAYNVLRLNSGGGEHNNLAYEAEVLDGEYTHLAVVSNPRYEGARIMYNSKGGSMKLKFWEKKKEVIENASEIDLEKAIVDVEGKEVSVKELLEVYNAANAPSKKMEIDTLIDIDGKKVAVKDLVETFKNSKAKAKNADEDKDGKGDELAKEEEEEKKRKAIGELKASLQKEHEEGKHDDRELKGCAMCNEADPKGEEHFNKVKNAAAQRGEPQQPVLVSRRDQAAEGKKRYGSEGK